MAKSEKNWIYKCKFAKYALFSNFLGGAKALEIWKKHAYFFQISNGREILLEIWKNRSIFSKFLYFQRAGNKYCWKFGKMEIFYIIGPRWILGRLFHIGNVPEIGNVYFLIAFPRKCIVSRK